MGNVEEHLEDRDLSENATCSAGHSEVEDTTEAENKQ